MPQTPTQTFFTTTVPAELQGDPGLGAAMGNLTFVIPGQGAWTIYGAEARVEPKLDPAVSLRLTLTQEAFEQILKDETAARPLLAQGASSTVVGDPLVAQSLYTLFRRARESA